MLRKPAVFVLILSMSESFPISSMFTSIRVKNPHHSTFISRSNSEFPSSRISVCNVKCSSKPRPGELTASELVKYLWNDVQFAENYPAPALEFFSDDVVYEDMVYSEPFRGKEQVAKFLINTKEKAPEDFVFVLDRC